MAYRIELCCNDPDNGNPVGAACAIRFSGSGADVGANCVNTLWGGGDIKIGLVPVENSCPGNNYASHKLQIGRVKIFCFEYRGWFGNWCWDAAWIAGVDALAIANYLERLKYWHCEEGPDKFYEKFNAREPLRYEDMP